MACWLPSIVGTIAARQRQTSGDSWYGVFPHLTVAGDTTMVRATLRREVSTMGGNARESTRQGGFSRETTSSVANGAVRYPWDSPRQSLGKNPGSTR